MSQRSLLWPPNPHWILSVYTAKCTSAQVNPLFSNWTSLLNAQYVVPAYTNSCVNKHNKTPPWCVVCNVPNSGVYPCNGATQCYQNGLSTPRSRRPYHNWRRGKGRCVFWTGNIAKLFLLLYLHGYSLIIYICKAFLLYHLHNFCE